jgi:subtilisin-like proprotein convertase family protein
MVIGCGGGAPDSTSSTPSGDLKANLPESAISQINALLNEKAARTPAQRKISSQLLYAASGRFPVLKHTLQKGETQPSGLRSLLRYDDQGRVLADLKGDVDAGLERQIEMAGGTMLSSSVEQKSARAWLPLGTLETLASHPVVKAIRPAFMADTRRANPPNMGLKYKTLSHEQRVAAMQKALADFAAAREAGEGGGPVTNAGSVTSEGSKAHAADRARKFYNTDGTGVKVGVLSDSDDFKEAAIASGDLPADTVTVPGQDGRPGSGEGTAMMEIVHDVAPGAKLFFATAFLSPESFADNIRRLRFEFGCDIIIDDVIYFFENPYQDDIIAQAVEDVTLDGALYFSSAGNEGNENDGTSGMWEGDFKSGGTLATLPSGYRVHDFGNKVISNRIDLAGGPLILHWSDPGTIAPGAGLASNDYDLFVLDFDLRNVVVASTDIQDGSGDDIPFEFLGFFIPENFRVVIAAKPGASTRVVRAALFGGELGMTTDGAVYGHAAVKTAFAVAAVDAAEAGGGEFTGGPTTPVELFSADGNRMTFYERDGTSILGGEAISNRASVRKVPQVAAADGVVTTLPPGSGLNPFFGTSAAAPHAGAIAALLKSAVPTAEATKIYNALKNGALDIEAAGVDRDSGNGVLNAQNALQKVGAKPAVFFDLGTVTATPTSGTAIIPGGSGTLTAQITNNGGATATVVKGTLISGTPGVTVTSGTLNYPNVAPGASATNATPFTFNVGASVPCGTKINFSLVITFTGLGSSPTVFSIPVQTGAPSATEIVTPYTGGVVPIPDANAAGVNIPFTASGLGAISTLSFRIDGTTCSATIGSTTVGVDHTWVGDLIFKLTSPAGTTVTLISQAGGAGNSGNNFCQTQLVDGAANSIQNVLISQAPFTGTFAPANPQSAFAGQVADGTWTLNVSDNAFIDTGSVRAFSIATRGFSCAP